MEVLFLRGSSCGKTEEIPAFYRERGIASSIGVSTSGVFEAPRVKIDKRPRDGKWAPRWGFKS